jgi:uncharacterized protein
MANSCTRDGVGASRAVVLSALALFLGGTVFAQSHPPIRTLTETELRDMMVGASILCSRGGDTQGMIDRVTKALHDGATFQMVSVADLPDDWFGFTEFGIGGGGAWPYVNERMQKQGFRRDPNGPTAVQVLSQYLGKKFDATFEAETGGATANTLLTGARLHIPVIDGCPSGRCLPEVQMSTFNLNHGITRAPFAGVTRFGDIFIVPSVHDDFRTEDITRALAVGSAGNVTIAANALPGKTLKENLIPGFLSKCIKLGRAAREAVASGKDPVQAVIDAGDGYLLFKGKVTRSDTKGERGFGWTDAYLQGTGEFAGSEYHIYNKNENMVAWRDGKLDAAAPDIINALDPKTGWAMRGGGVIGGFVVGQELTVVGFPNNDLLRTPQVIEGMGPKHFGFADEYVKIEELHKRTGRAN